MTAREMHDKLVAQAQKFPVVSRFPATSDVSTDQVQLTSLLYGTVIEISVAYD